MMKIWGRIAHWQVRVKMVSFTRRVRAGTWRLVLHLTFGMAVQAEFMFYGMQREDAQVIRSAIDVSLEDYRRNLGMMMAAMDKIFVASDVLDSIVESFAEVHDEWKKDIKQIPLCHEQNERVTLSLLCTNAPRLTLGVLNQPSLAYFPLPEVAVSPMSSYNSIQQLLIHLGRDWGDTGQEARRDTYTTGILEALVSNIRHISISSSEHQGDNGDGGLSVLVPGAGMGRLAMEIAAAGGFNVEANECSGPMVHAMHAMLTDILPAFASTTDSAGAGSATEFFPFLHFELVDEWDFRRRFAPSYFPTRGDTNSILRWIRRSKCFGKQCSSVTKTETELFEEECSCEEGSEPGGGFSVQYGDFLSAYGEESRRDSFDVVVTCFFLDTFSRIVEPLAVIQHVLRPGGLWVNAGPLHYHNKPSVPYSYAQVERMINALNFTKLSGRTIHSHYHGESANFMKPQVYNFPLSVWKKDSSRGDGESQLLTNSLLQKISDNRAGGNESKRSNAAHDNVFTLK